MPKSISKRLSNLLSVHDIFENENATPMYSEGTSGDKFGKNYLLGTSHGGVFMNLMYVPVCPKKITDKNITDTVFFLHSLFLSFTSKYKMLIVEL